MNITFHWSGLWHKTCTYYLVIASFYSPELSRHSYKFLKFIKCIECRRVSFEINFLAFFSFQKCFDIFNLGGGNKIKLWKSGQNFFPGRKISFDQFFVQQPDGQIFCQVVTSPVLSPWPELSNTRTWAFWLHRGSYLEGNEWISAFSEFG